MIPKQLQHPDFRFAPLKGIYLVDGKKKLIFPEKDWQDKNNYQHDSKELQDNFKLNRGYVVVCGIGKMLVIDIDKKSPDFETLILLAENLPQTFTVKTWSGGRHYYFLCNKLTTKTLKNDGGEIRGKGACVIGAGSKVEKKEYTVFKDLPIAEIKRKELEAIFKDWLSPETQGKNKVQKTAKQILADPHPTEQERVSMVMKIIENESNWKDFNKEKTREKVETVVKKYADKPNPNKEEKKTTLKLKSASDLFKFKPRKDFIIDQFIYPQNIIMIYSPPKNYKSLLALKICMDVANGKKFFGLKTKKTNVLYCDRENNETLIHQRLHALKKGSPKQYQRKNFPLHFLIRQGDLENDFWIDQLIETIRERKIKLVVFDTMKRYSTNFDENSANDVNRIYTKAYQPLIDECDCSIIFLHHTNKDGQFRGSGDFLGLVDSAYSISKTKNEFKISCLAARGGEIDEIQGSVDIEQDSHKQLTSFEFIQKSREEIEEAASEAWVKLKTACDLIMRHFLSNGLDSYQKKDIENAILLEQKGQISPTTIKRAFKHLVFKKILMTDGRGKYTKIGEWL